MIFRVPSYYKDFQCIAGACEHSCCIGWEVDIDEETSSYYKSVKGAFGKRLAEHMVSEDVDRFALKENGWCPFLNEQKLCDICIELGEEALSEVCTEYPRFTMEYEQVREKILSISCEEVGRILFSSQQKEEWQEWSLPEEMEQEEQEESAGISAKRLEEVRARAVELLQDRTRPVFVRAVDYLEYCTKMQRDLFGGRLKEDVGEKAIKGNDTDWQAYADFQKRIECLEALEVLDENWTKTLQEMCRIFREDNYNKMQREFMGAVREREYEYEHLLVYFTFRYFMRAYYDGNILTKAQLAVFCVLSIRDMDVARYFANGKKFDLQDRIDTARIYSREVEHSEENLELLAEDFLFEEVCQPAAMIRQLVQ